MQYDRSLLTVDILGAQPKSRNQYMNRLLPNQLRFQDQMLAQQQIPKQDYKFGRKRYQHDFHHFCNICIPQGEDHFEKTNKRHYEIPEGEIKQFRALENLYDQPKLLCTNDIDGAVPGSLQSQAVRNQEIAQKIRQQRNEERVQKNRELYHSQIDQVVTPQIETQHRNKSFSVQPYTENKLRLPPISDRVDSVINPVTNKLQLRQQRNYLLEDQEKTLRMLQKQTPLRLFI